ncbi:MULTISPECIES: hypothetical protein [unclassified Myroides]|uniref:hypothetical protein n=1 Tax=unclassified Myroides TaxID=2642485 RepID=UPI003D2F6615
MMCLKKRISILFNWVCIGCFLLWMVFSCLVQPEPATTEFFIGNYLGIAVFEEEAYTVQRDTTTIRAIKIGDKMSFIFSDSIPTIAKVVVKKNKEGDLINLHANETNYIRLHSRKLEILFTDGNRSWFVYADRL